jgi:hypothetical protein
MALVLLANTASTPVWAQQPPPPGLSIVIVEGEGAINNIRQRVNREPIVQVEDENRRPVAGAAVTFFLPDSGPSGTFLNGSRMLTVTTDAQGRAAATGIQPNNQAGQMQIRVTASSQGRTATATITQTNAVGAAAAGAGGGLSALAKVLIVLGIAGGAAAGGIIAATSGNGNGNGGGGGPTPGVVLTPGTPTVGGPR